jgi:hypothetical protein
MICSFSHGLCFLELALSGVVLGFTFAIGGTLWRLITTK